MTVYAVFEACGKQHKAYTEGRNKVIKLDKIEQEPGTTVEFDKILLVKNGDNLKVGTPYVQGCKIVAKVVEHGRDKKINVIKFKRRKNYKRTYGHRQWYTLVEVESIGS